MHQRERIERRRDKAVLFIETPHDIVLCVNQDDANADPLTYFECFQHEVFQQRFRNAPTLICQPYRQACQKYRRKNVWLVSSNRLRRGLSKNRRTG